MQYNNTSAIAKHWSVMGDGAEVNCKPTGEAVTRINILIRGR